MSIIALMTDFGSRDHYVACTRGMILQIDPRAVLADVTHDIPAQDVLHGAFTLRQAFPFFPAGTIFVAVVDPGVGTQRRILAAQYQDRVVIAPDNGILTLIHRDAELQDVRVVENRRFFASILSNTFHGRDIMAPVAAHLSRGARLEQLGPVADHIESIALASPTVHENGNIDGQVLLVDHFGNLITNISEIDLNAAMSLRRELNVYIGDQKIGPLAHTYSDVKQGEPLALVGSTQMLEIAVNQGSAADAFQAARGTAVTVRE